MKTHRTLILISIVIFAVAIYILGWSTFFTVSSIEIKGTNSILSTTIKPGQKLARVEPRTITSEFERLEWIERAEVSRNWITGKVTISLTERTPIAIFNDRAIDAKGFSFALRGNEDSDLPHIAAASVETAITAAGFFSGLPAQIADAVQIIEVVRGDAYVLEIISRQRAIEVRWGQDVENALKVKVYKALVNQPENSKIIEIDLSAPHAPIVK